MGKSNSVETLTPEEDHWVRLAQLHSALAAGNLPLVTELGGMRLEENETVHAIVAAQRVEFYGTQESYNSGFVAAGGTGPLGLAMLGATIGGSLLFNRASKQAAKKRAAEQWRLVDQGYLIITNQRLALHGQREWVDIWYPHIRMSSLGAQGFQIHLAGTNPIALTMGYPEWYYYLFRYLSTNGRECPPVVLPAELSSKVLRLNP
jgi:hypothetical protein